MSTPWIGHPFEYAQRQHAHPHPPADRTRGARTWLGWCLVFVTEAFGVGPRYPDAATAWTNARRKHYTRDPESIPRGVPIFWTGGSSGHGHVAFSRGGGSCWTTDLIRRGQVDAARIADVERRWGLHLVGWSEDINGVRVYHPVTPKRGHTGPTRVQNARQAFTKGLAMLGRAVSHGRRGRVREVRNSIADDLERLPKS